ncbi:MAG TPA: hypothetical protein VE467_08410 [Chryseolinea sp.]|jgi:hypothetical protein|nr:hypothetical protein [Chryseolinea sp.]
MTAFLDYYKMILDKVSFDRNLFYKEYRKAVRNLQPDEITELDYWLSTKNFPNGVSDQVIFQAVRPTLSNI